MEMDLQLVPLHHHPQYIKVCCDMLNAEWKKSDSARMHSLGQSCDTLPINLVLLKDNNEVIGHAKLAKIPTMKEACSLESVVIAKHLRRKGFGRTLMEKTERYCREHFKKEIVYLSTHDQVEFYTKLGYKQCPPITIYGGPVLANTSNNCNVPVLNNCNGPLPKEVHIEDVLIPPPPPPPLPSAQIVPPIKENIVYFMKQLE